MSASLSLHFKPKKPEALCPKESKPCPQLASTLPSNTSPKTTCFPDTRLLPKENLPYSADSGRRGLVFATDIYTSISAYTYTYIYIYVHVCMLACSRGLYSSPGGAYVWRLGESVSRRRCYLINHGQKLPGFAGMGSAEVCVTDDK